MFCYNCHKPRHVASNCPHPVQSYGIICVRTNNGIIEYLMVERRFSYAFVDFICGFYNIFDYEFIQSLFDRMTLFERCLIHEHKFQSLWNRFWTHHRLCYRKKSFWKQFYKAGIKFNVLQNGFVHDEKYYCTQLFLDHSSLNFKRPEWYFPKGKKLHCGENPKDCAIREFSEETSLLPDSIELMPNVDPVTETHKAGALGRTFISRFFIARCMIKNIKFDITENPETNDAQWFTMDECLKMFRDYETEKKQLMLNVNEILSHIDIHTLDDSSAAS